MLLEQHRHAWTQMNVLSFTVTFPPVLLLDPLTPPPLPQDRVEVNGARLKISNLALEDSGMYQCVAENKHGTIYSSAELRVQGM